MIDGNVGIGTTSPQNALDVVGAVTVSKGLNASNLNVTGFSITDDSLVTVVEFGEDARTDTRTGSGAHSVGFGTNYVGNKKEEKSGFHSLAIAPRQNLVSTRTKDINQLCVRISP